MKNIFTLLVSAILLAFASCTEEIETFQTSGEPGSSISVTAGINTTGTRVALTQNGNDITLTWEGGDILHLCFVDGDNPDIKVTDTVTIQEITESGKKSKFFITIPEEITSETFDL